MFFHVINKSQAFWGKILALILFSDTYEGVYDFRSQNINKRKGLIFQGKRRIEMFFLTAKLIYLCQ